MLAALLSLLVVLLFIRLAVYAIRQFLVWLRGGKEIEWLVRGNYVDTEYAEGLREYIRQTERTEFVEQVEGEVEGKRPRLTHDQRKALRKAHIRARDEYLDRVEINWYQIAIIFLVGSFLGLIIEEVWMYITAGLTESRVGLVWGPYSPIYGFGASFLTIFCWMLRKRGASKLAVFLVAMLVGGVLEQVTGWGMETFLGVVSWDYTNVPLAITKFVAVPFLFFWGALGLIWSERIMPELIFLIGMPTTARQVTFVSLVALYLVADIGMTVACFSRMAARDAGIPPQTPFQEWVDNHYTDQFIAARFQNMAFDNK